MNVEEIKKSLDSMSESEGKEIVIHLAKFRPAADQEYRDLISHSGPSATAPV